MEHTPTIPERDPIRGENEANVVVNAAITEVIDAFKDEITERDKELLISVVREVSTSPKGRVMYLMRLPSLVGASDNMTQYVNQILLTLRQTFNGEEQEKFRGWGTASLLDEIN